MPSLAWIIPTDGPRFRRCVAGLALVVSACSSSEHASLAPVGVNGSLQTLVANRKTADGSSDFVSTTAANITATTYIWQPWLATVSADANVAYDFSTSSDIGTSLRAGGSINLDILPQSKYPVSISAGHYESGIGGNYLAGEYVRNFASIRARAAITPTIRSGFLFSWDNVDELDSGVRTSLNSNINIDKSFTPEESFLGITSIGLNANYRKNDFVATDVNEDDSIYEAGNVRLTFRGEPLPDVVVDGRFGATLLNFESEDDADTQLIVQGLTTAQWRPKDRPYTGTGTLRVLWEDFARTDAGDRRERGSKLISATAGLRWPLDDNLSLNAGARLSYEDVTRDEGIRFPGNSDETGVRFEGGIILGANYWSDSYAIRGFDWRWNAQVSTDNGFDTEAGIDSRNFLQFQHRIERSLRRLLSMPVDFTLSQAIELRMDTEDDDGPFSAELTHAFSLGYNYTDGSSNRYARLTARDSRNIVGKTRSLQIIRFRMGERLALSRYQRISGDVNARAGRSVFDDGDVDTAISLTAEIRYEHRELFDTDGLYFRSILRANLLNVDSLLGVSDRTFRDSAINNNDWRNILSYRIGRLTTEAEASAFHQDSGLGYLLMLRLRREFGGTY